MFDLDHTLLAGDSEHLWGLFLASRRGADIEAQKRESHRFYEDYSAGRLDFDEYMSFQLGPMAAVDSEQLLSWRERYISEIIKPRIAPQAPALLEHHLGLGHTLVIITAANRFVSQPIADTLGVSNLLSTEPEFKDGRFTGRIVGDPCFREGKITHLRSWLDRQEKSFDESWCYSDSHNDLPLLEQVSNPVAVDPDPLLKRIASRRRWPIISLRGAKLGPLPESM